MRASFEQIERVFCQALANADGDVAEFGVWRGDTFIPLARAAAALGRASHAVDSFRGMAEPTPQDAGPDGRQQYPAGALDAGGSGALRQAVAEITPAVRIWEGFIPEVLDRVEIDAGLAFVHIDLDHFAPTLQACRWCWLRFNAGGAMCIHDWLPRRQRLATGGVKQFMRETGATPAGTTVTRHIWFVR